MQLINLSYQDTNWELSNLELQQLNLIVAPNATGKSRTLATIDLLIKMITQKRNLNWGSRWRMEFMNLEKQLIVFDFATKFQAEGLVTHEEISVDGKQVLFRNRRTGTVSLLNYITQKKEIVSPPTNKLTLHTNRDIKKYPYLETIVAWAEQSYGFKFGNISPYARLNTQEYDLLTAVEDIPNLFNSLKKESKEQIIQTFNEIGYKISNITAKERGEDVVLFVEEVALEKPLPHYKLSQGMLRTLALLIYTEYLISRKKPALVIIDDLCEGLDYSKAKKLGTIIFEKCKNSEIQLVVTSNDNFLMDTIDIQYWNVLNRVGKKVTAMNIKTNGEVFKKFKFTGLSNFDFFSSDFLAQQTK